jgi:hypothetical protein
MTKECASRIKSTENNLIGTNPFFQDLRAYWKVVMATTSLRSIFSIIIPSKFDKEEK